jgi:hypothetical protein
MIIDWTGAAQNAPGVLGRGDIPRKDRGARVLPASLGIDGVGVCLSFPPHL